MTVANSPEAADAITRQFLDRLGRGITFGVMLNLDPLELETVYALGHTLYQQRRFEDAAKIFGFLVLHDHLERRYITAFAAALQMNREYASAIQLYTIATLMDLTDLAPCFHTCECLVALGLKAEACQGLAMVVRQCEQASQRELRERAQSLLALLEHVTSDSTMETMT